ncbi:ParB/RepB/Spo0J family partition protein [Xenorhabdus bovienii]|uniref:transcriptional repressor gene korB n=1 Tax=Xenorhabdus bovienii TaxID=40576 RepID=UPI003DA46A84
MTSNKNKSSLGLDAIGDLSGLLDGTVLSTSPIELDILLIDEDPNQPRTEGNPGFMEQSLSELAETIRLRGVKTPISVRDNPDIPGRYIINHGARRMRASKLAGKTSIPGFIDNDYNEIDQVIENLQRNELTAREIADFIGRELAKGKKKGEIAKDIGKSAAFVTQHVTLLDLPDVIAKAFNSGRIKDVTVINELVTAFKKNAKAVTDWLEDEEQDISRGAVKLLREFLDEKDPTSEEDNDQTDFSNSLNNSSDPNDDSFNPDIHEDNNDNLNNDSNSSENNNSDDLGETKQKQDDCSKLKKAFVEVLVDERTARIMLDRRPSLRGLAWFKYEDNGEEFEAELSEARLIAIIEG